jgi:hypothetical protein
MTTRLASITVAVILSVLVWAALARMVMGDSQQTCEQTTSQETCVWELR